MSIVDDTIVVWKDDFAAGDMNVPQDTAKFMEELGLMVRTMKKVVRQESERKMWLPAKLTVSAIPTVGGNTIVFSGDVTSLLAPGRFIMIPPPFMVPERYLQVRGASFDGAATLCFVSPVYRFVGLMDTDSPNITRVSDHELAAVGNVVSDYSAGTKLVIIQSAASGYPVVKVVDEATHDAGVTTIALEDDDAPVPTGTFYLYKEGATLPKFETGLYVYLGTFDSDPRKSALPHATQAGQVKIDRDTTVALPLPEADTQYTIIPTVVDRPGAGSVYESLVLIQNRTLTTFDVILNLDPIEVGGSGGFVTIDWILVRYAQPAANSLTSGA